MRSVSKSRNPDWEEDESNSETEMDLDDQEEEELEDDEDVESEEEDLEDGDDVDGEEEDDEEDDGEGEDEAEDSEEEEEDGEEDEEEEEKRLGQKDTEMEELEQEYLNIRQEQDILRNLKRHKDEDLLKGQAVKNQKVIWDKSLEFRFLLQKVFSASNKLPQEPIKSSFSDADKAVDKAYSDVITSSAQTINSLLALQEALLEKNPSIVQNTDGNIKEAPNRERSKSSSVESDEEWLSIQRMQSRIASFRNSSVDKWKRKTEVTTGAAGFKGKLQAFNQNISEQVAAYMRDPSRMIKRMQLKRSTVGVLGAAPDMVGPGGEEDVNADGDPELLDDSEFYEQLLKEFLESYKPVSFEADFYALKRLQTKKRKIVDRRASKCRKIRYHVHEKIRNFVAPGPLDLPPVVPKLFENLFGLRSQKPTAMA